MSEWGPWIEHDHSGIPVPIGTVVHRVFDAPFDMMCGEYVNPTQEHIGPVSASERLCWSGGAQHPLGRVATVIRYRVRKPLGLTVLEQIARSVRPVETPERELVE